MMVSGKIRFTKHNLRKYLDFHISAKMQNCDIKINIQKMLNVLCILVKSIFQLMNHTNKNFICIIYLPDMEARSTSALISLKQCIFQIIMK